MKKCLIFLILFLGVTPSLSYTAEPIFIPLKIDGPEHDPENGTFWYGPFSEGSAVFDVNGDGILDITCGANWYEGPDWTKHENFRDNATIEGEYVNNNSEFSLDVNRDGKLDLVSAGWMSDGVFWYENPGRTGIKWKATKIISSESTEALMIDDIDGDGDNDVIVNHWENLPGQSLVWLELTDKPEFAVHSIGTEGDLHGVGVGDINGDNRKDIVTIRGWYEAPRNPASEKWIFHDDFRLRHEAGIPMEVFDVNEDGRNDIIYGYGHNYGLEWLEQVPDGTWKNHVIEDSFGQFHVMAIADVNQDGNPDLVTGKRLRGHNGGDESSFDPMFVFWYEIQGGEFKRHVLSYNHLPWYPNSDISNPPPNYAIGAGMNITVIDINNDEKVDIVCASKSGLYIFLNRGFPPTSRLDRRR